MSIEISQTEMQREKKNHSRIKGQLQTVYHMHNAMSGEERESKRNILSNNDWECFKIDARKQTTDPGSSENTRQNKYQKNLYLSLSYLNCRKPKAKIFETSPSGKTPYLYRKMIKIHQTFLHKPCKQETGGVKYVKWWK